MARLDPTGVSRILSYIKNWVTTALGGKANSSHTHTKSQITDFPSIPSKTSQLTNDSGFLTAHQSLSNYSTLANTVKSLSISGKTITVTPGSGSAYTLTTQDTVYTHPTTAGNKHIPSGGSANQYLKYSASGTAVWANLPTIPSKTSQLTNDSGFLTAHQSLSNYLTKTATVSEMGRYIDMHYDNATAAYDYDVRLQVNSQGTANGGGVLQIVGASVKASKFEGPLTGNVTGNCSGSSGSCTGNAATATSAGYVQGNNNSANAANALLRSGSGRTDSSPEGDTWIFLDELGGSSAPWGFKHNQRANTIGFYGAGTETSSINLSNGYFSGSCNYANSAGGVAWGNVSGKPSSYTPSSHNHDSVYLKLSGGTITGNISKNNAATSWVQGRNAAPFRTIAASSPGDSQYVPCWSAKSYQGSWDCGPYTSNVLHLSYITDANYNSGNNAQTADFTFATDGTFNAKVLKQNGTVVSLSGHTHTKSQITDFPTIPTKTSQLTNDSGFWTGGGGTWNPNANISLPASGNGQEWSFDMHRNGKTGCYWHVWEDSLGTLLKVNADDGAVSVPRNIFYLGSYKVYVG